MSQTQPELMALAHAIAKELNAIDGHTWAPVNSFIHLHPSRRWPALLLAKHWLPLAAQ